jgi:hypothetical protein
VQVSDGIPTLIKVLSKSMDSSLTSDKVELATITRDEATGKVRKFVTSSNTQRCSGHASVHGASRSSCRTADAFVPAAVCCWHTIGC